MTLSLFDRKSSWEEAQAHCESLHKTLLQFTMSMYLDIRAFHYSMGEDFRELMFLGLSKNEKVRVNANHRQDLRRSTKYSNGASTYAIYCRILIG